MNSAPEYTGPPPRLVANPIEKLEIYRCYMRSPYLSIKHSSYFQVYTELFETYRGKPITFVEIGVQNGGSLFMWREFFGSKARIIGIDLNPAAQKWKADGFEIFIGNQADPKFWQELFAKVGVVDAVLDDGGHTNEQQIVTASQCIPHIADGGILVVEDTHTSYQKDYGNPSRYSFIEWAKKQADTLHSRFPGIQTANPLFRDSIYSVGFFESIVCFRIDRTRCFESRPTSNGGESISAKDLGRVGTSAAEIGGFATQSAERFPWLRRLPGLRSFKDAVIRNIAWLNGRRAGFRVKKYF